MKRKKAELRLGNGRVLEGWSFGYDGPATGEVVFSTSMVGYPESLTDPSFQGQILCVSYPLVGNYGTPDMSTGPDGLSLRAESERIQRPRDCRLQRELQPLGCRRKPRRLA